jgi:hypothetical protein
LVCNQLSIPSNDLENTICIFQQIQIDRLLSISRRYDAQNAIALVRRLGSQNDEQKQMTS